MRGVFHPPLPAVTGPTGCSPPPPLFTTAVGPWMYARRAISCAVKSLLQGAIKIGYPTTAVKNYIYLCSFDAWLLDDGIDGWLVISAQNNYLFFAGRLERPNAGHRSIYSLRWFDRCCSAT